jgi:hypothetical protein
VGLTIHKDLNTLSKLENQQDTVHQPKLKKENSIEGEVENYTFPHKPTPVPAVREYRYRSRLPEYVAPKLKDYRKLDKEQRKEQNDLIESKFMDKALSRKKNVKIYYKKKEQEKKNHLLQKYTTLAEKFKVKQKIKTQI